MKVTPGVHRTPLPTTAPTDTVRIDRFFYPPGGHTQWHLHTGEQVLYGESGRGWVQFDDAERTSLDPGTAVHVAIGRRHWHGATPDHELVHLAVTMGGDTVWLGEVTAAEYAGEAAQNSAAATPPETGSVVDPSPNSTTATTPDSGDVVKAFIAALEGRDLEAALEWVADDIVYDNVPIGSVTGPDAVRATLSGAIGRADRVEWVIRHQVVTGDVVMNERLDRFLVDGRWVEVPVAGLFVVRDGLITLWRDYFDLETYRSQSRQA